MNFPPIPELVMLGEKNHYLCSMSFSSDTIDSDQVVYGSESTSMWDLACLGSPAPCFRFSVVVFLSIL
jgi:hypothetical protein